MMSDYRFIKLLKDKKVADAYQYFEASAYKLYLAELSYSALKNVITKYQANEEQYVKKVYEDAWTKGEGSYKQHADVIDYLGISVSPTVMMDKLTMEIMSLLHNFFDTFAQWINTSLLAEDGIPMERASLPKVIKKFLQFPEYTGNFASTLSTLDTSAEYLYIADFNNTLKHRRQIYVENKFDILSIKGNVSVPEFSKDGRPHVKEDALSMLKSKIDFCHNILKSSKSFVEGYYATADNMHVSHRCYNPATYLFFESEEDYKAMRSPKNHYYYIEVESSMILNEYHLMLCCDRMDETQDESIEFFNAPYPIIMLRETGTEKIVGLLKPLDNEERSIRDAREIAYRKYSAVLNDYEHEMYTAICSDERFNYYPYLSDLTAVYKVSPNEQTENNKSGENSQE